MITTGHTVAPTVTPLHRKRLHRYELPNQGRFLTFSCYHRLPLFGNSRIRDLFAAALGEARDRDRFRLIAWVVMPEHVHLYIMPEPPRGEITRSLWRLKRDFAKLVIARWRDLGASVLTRITDATGRPHFWKPGGGYDRNIRSEDEHREKIEYIHNNPVKRGLVRDPTQWKWSSSAWYAGVREGQLPIDRI